MADDLDCVNYKLSTLEKVFDRACTQVILLNLRIICLKARYDRARATNKLAFRYSNRLKLTSLEGVRNMWFKYAGIKAREINDLRKKIRNFHRTGVFSDVA